MRNAFLFCSNKQKDIVFVDIATSPDSKKASLFLEAISWKVFYRNSQQVSQIQVFKSGLFFFCCLLWNTKPTTYIQWAVISDIRLVRWSETLGRVYILTQQSSECQCWLFQLTVTQRTCNKLHRYLRTRLLLKVSALDLSETLLLTHYRGCLSVSASGARLEENNVIITST